MNSTPTWLSWDHDMEGGGRPVSEPAPPLYATPLLHSLISADTGVLVGERLWLA